jgi:hypothetical protein
VKLSGGENDSLERPCVHNSDERKDIHPNFVGEGWIGSMYLINSGEDIHTGEMDMKQTYGEVRRDQTVVLVKS